MAGRRGLFSHDGNLLRESPGRVRAVEAEHPARGLWGTGECLQVRLYLAGLVLADVQPGADSADAGHLPGREVSGEQLGGGFPVAVQPGERAGYVIGYGGYGAQQVRERRAEPERGDGQAGHQHHDGPRCPRRVRGVQQVVDHLAQHAERQGAERRPAREGPRSLRCARRQPRAERERAVRLDADRQRDRGVQVPGDDAGQRLHQAEAAQRTEADPSRPHRDGGRSGDQVQRPALHRSPRGMPSTYTRTSTLRPRSGYGWLTAWTVMTCSSSSVISRHSSSVPCSRIFMPSPCTCRSCTARRPGAAAAGSTAARGSAWRRGASRRAPRRGRGCSRRRRGRSRGPPVASRGHAQRAQRPHDQPGEHRARGQLDTEDGGRGRRVREHQEHGEDDRGGLHAGPFPAGQCPPHRASRQPSPVHACTPAVRAAVVVVRTRRRRPGRCRPRTRPAAPPASAPRAGGSG